MSLKQLAHLVNSDLVSLMEQPLHYASIQGAASLRRQIIAFHHALNQHQIELNIDNVLTFAGAQEALSCIYHSTLHAGDEVVLMTPCYPSLQIMAENLGCKVRSIKVTACMSQLDLYAQFKAAINQHTKLVVLNSPHNPTGLVIDSSLAEQLMVLVKQFNCFLLCDDVAQASNFQELSLSHQFLDYENTVVVSVMSKSFGLAGCRVGWAISQNNVLMKALLSRKAFGSICTSMLDEKIAELALRYWPAIVTQNNQVIKNNVAKFDAFCRQFSEYIAWVPPKAGILSVATIKQTTDIEKWCKSLAHEQKLLLLPLTLFQQPGNQVRIGLGLDNLEQCLTKLACHFNANY